MAQTSVLKAEARDRVGKGAARAVRREDKIPAVIYGDKKPPIPITLPQREMTHRLHAGGFLTHLIEIEVGGENDPRHPQGLSARPGPRLPDPYRFPPRRRRRAADPRRAGALHQPRRLAGPEARRRAERRPPLDRDGGSGRCHSGIRHRRPDGARHRQFRAHLRGAAAGGRYARPSAAATSRSRRSPAPPPRSRRSRKARHRPPPKARRAQPRPRARSRPKAMPPRSQARQRRRPKTKARARAAAEPRPSRHEPRGPVWAAGTRIAGIVGCF